MRFLLAAILALLSLRADAFIQHGEFANTFVNTPLTPNAPLDPNSAALGVFGTGCRPGGQAVSELARGFPMDLPASQLVWRPSEIRPT
jgi:hypothetical protein